jgi:hypothetical protein
MYVCMCFVLKGNLHGRPKGIAMGLLLPPWPAKNISFLDFFQKNYIFFLVFRFFLVPLPGIFILFLPSPGKKSADAHGHFL